MSVQSRQAKSHSPNTAPTKTAEAPQKAAVSAASASRVPAWAGGMNDLIPTGLVLQDASTIPGTQAKLAISQPTDPYEQEADRVAEQVMRMPASPAPVQGQRKCACGGIAGPTGECEACTAKRKALQRRATQQTSESAAPPIDNQVLSSGNGQPLDAGTRAFMEPRFGTDFSQVRVHTDGQAAESAQSVNALAYTVGSDVVFGKGQYKPQTSEGQKLLAHELTHVMQQQTQTSNEPPGIQRAEGSPESSSKAKSQVSGAAAQAGGLLIPWRGSFRSSLFEFIKQLHQSDDMAAQITADLMGSAQYFVEGKQVSLEQLEAEVVRTGKTSITIGARMVNALMQAVGMDLKRLQIASEIDQILAPLTGKDIQVGDLSPEKVSEKAERWEPVVPTRGSWEVLEGNGQLASYYLDLMQHFAGLNVTDAERETAKKGLSKEELGKIIGNNKTFQHFTNLFAQGYQEFQQAGGKNIEQFKPLEERIFEQYIWGNPTAVQNLLRIGEGWPERGQIGIVHRTSGMLLYNSKGEPLPSFGGTQKRDPGFAGAPQQDTFGINIAPLKDAAPVLFQILNELRQQLGDPTRVVARAAEVYYNNVELVNQRVMAGGELTGEIKKRFEQALPVFVGFLVGHGISTFLMRAPNPVMVSIGLALKGLLAAAGWILNIDFAGSAIERLLESGYHLSRIQQGEDKKLTALSDYHLEEAAKPIRSMIADIAVMATFMGFSKLLGAIGGKESATIECTKCGIKEGKTGETKGNESEQGKEAEQGKKKVETGATGKEYTGVKIIDSDGKPLGEFDKIDLEKGRFIEEKSAEKLYTPHPKTGKPVQTPEQWAANQIYNKTIVRIENFINKAVGTMPEEGGTREVPKFDVIKGIRDLVFRIKSTDTALQNAVNEQVKLLQVKYSDWHFSVEFGD